MSRIEIKHVCKTIRGIKVIDDITLTLESGRIIGLKGINGSGKTMLMRLVCGLIKPSSGEIIIDNERLGKDISFPRSAGILLENPAFLDYYSGKDNLKLLASIKGQISDEDIRNAIMKVGLDPEDTKKYRKYSLGMKQRLGIAAAIMEKPDIIILDEPTNSLDSDGVQLVKNIVEEEKKRGALIIMACHDYEVLSFLCDEIHTIVEGRLTKSEQVEK